MSIRSRIKSIENHLSNAYNSITNLGLYEDNTNKNMENISPLLDEFYNKVSDKTDLNQNGVVGRTSQETITEEAGINVINTSIYIDDVNTDKEHIIELKGNTSQYTTTGKNLFDKDNLNIITNKYLNDSGDEINDNNFSISDYIRVEPNTIYSGQPYENKSACICFYNSSKTFLSSVRLTTVNPNFTTPNDCVYIRSSLFKADIDNIQIEKGSTASDYEPFTGNQSSPNPDYPQDIQVVTGDNSIRINSKNFFNSNATPALNNLSDAGITSVINSDGTITVNGTKTANYKYIKYYILLPAGTYYFSGCPSDGTKYTYSSLIQTGGSESPQIFDEGNGNTFTLTKPTTITYYPVRVGQNDVTFNNTVFKPIISRVPVTYNDFEKYQGLQTYPVNLTSKNISNWMQGLINSSGAFLDSQLAISTDFIPVKNGDTFTAQKNTTFTGTNDNMTCRLYDTNKNYLSSVFTLGYNNLTQTITLNNADVAYVRFTQFRQDGLLVNNDYEIMVEKGSTATSYVPYFEPIELCKIDTYQDKIYKNNDKWYLEKNVGKETDDGSSDEGWGKLNREINGCYGFRHNGSYSEILICDKLTNYTAGQLYNGAGEGIGYSPTGSYLAVYIKSERVNSYDVSALRTFLSNNPITFYYQLSTPITTEITDTTLINQLNALRNSDLYSITNINTVASNLLPYIDLTYNKVTPSPSPDRPSEIDTLTGDVDYKISGKNLCNLEKLKLLVGTNGNVIHNEYFQNVIINTTNINSLYISGDYTLLSDNALRIGGFNEYPVINSQGTRVTLYENGSVDTTSYDYILLCFAVNTLVIEHTFDEIKNSFMVNIGSTATSYEPYISQTYQIKLGNIELCKINTYEDKIYSNDGKFYLEKNIGKVVLDGSQSESWSYTNVSQGSLFRNSTIITNEITNKNYSPYSNYYKCIPENNYLNRQNNELYIQSTNNYLDIIDNRFTSANDFKTWLSTHNTEVYYVLATPTTTEITSDNYPELYESLKQIQDYLVQYKINNEFILDYSSPNIEY